MEPSNLSGEQSFFPSTAAKTRQSVRFQVNFEYRSDMDLKQLPGFWKIKMVNYSISSSLNSAFSTIGKATADKITAKLEGKNSRFRFCVFNYYYYFFCIKSNR